MFSRVQDRASTIRKLDNINLPVCALFFIQSVTYPVSMIYVRFERSELPVV